MSNVSISIDMGRVLDELGLQARRNSSGEWKAHCPKHLERIGKQDNKPSWSINEDTGLFNCFSCGYKGGLVQLVVDMSPMTMWEALRWLHERGMQSLEISDDTPEPLSLSLQNLAPTTEDQFRIFSRPPKSARVDRGLTDDAIRYYDIRWSNDGFAIPITRFDGKFLGYQWKKRKQVLNFPQGVRKGLTLFGLDRYPPWDVQGLVLVESPLDVLRLYQCGIAGVASFGASVTTEQLELLVSFTDRVILALDDDIAGRTQARKAYEYLRDIVPVVKLLDYSVTEKRNGKRPKDVGDMTNDEIRAAVAGARYGPEASLIGLLVPPLKEKKK